MILSAHNHSFGGHSMDRYIFENETAEAAVSPDAAPVDAASDGGGLPAEPAAPGAAETAPATPEAPAAPSLDQLIATDDGRQALDTWFNERLDQLAQEQQQTKDRQAGDETAQERLTRIREGLELIGVDPDELTGYLKEQLGIAPLQNLAEQQQQQELVAWATSQLATLGEGDYKDLLGDGVAPVKGGDVDFTDTDAKLLLDNNRFTVLATANALSHQAGGQLDPAVALTEAAKWQAQRDQLVGRAAVARHLAGLETVSGAARDITGGGQGSDGVDFDGDEIAYIRHRTSGQ